MLGFSFGVLQMVLYGVYKRGNRAGKKLIKLPEIENEQVMVVEEQKNPEICEHVIEIVKLSTFLSPADKTPAVSQVSNNGVEASLRRGN